MKIRHISILLLAATGFIVAACAPMRMGLEQATLETLLEKQTRCDQLRKAESKSDAEMIECQNNRNALENTAGEYAAEGARQEDPANKVFWFSLAATAGWRSQRPQGMQDAITYADEGGKICDDNPGIQPGDCAYMYAIPAFVTNESVSIGFIDIDSKAENAEKAETVAEKKKALQELLLAPQPDGSTRIEAMASTLLWDGWASLQTSWENVGKLEGLHPDVICALEKNQKRIVDNLKALHTRANYLPLLPGNTTWLAVNLCDDGEINSATTAELNLAPEGADFATLDEDGKQSLMQRAIVHTYCTWQYALQNTESSNCP